MNKICCDKCGKDVLPREVWQTGVKGMKFHIQVVGDYCFHCMIDAVKSLDDRGEDADEHSVSIHEEGGRFTVVVKQPAEDQSPTLEPPVIMPAWEDLPKGQVKYTLWYPEHSKCVFSEFEYNVIRNALQSAQKPKGAV